MYSIATFALMEEEMEMPSKQPCWFEHWFDSPYYHLLYKHRDEDEAQFFIDNLVKKLALNKGAKILDLACGKGRHAIHMNNLGYDVIGIDLSEESISIAKKAENETLAFFVHDMRELYWADHFDCVLNLFTSFGYFDEESDNLKTLQSVHDGLKPGSVLVIDFMNVAKALRELIAAEIITVEDAEFHINRTVKDDFLIKNIEVRKGGTIQHFMEKVHLLHLDHFKKYFAETGFDIINLWGNYSLEDFNAETSERLIIVGRKLIINF